VGDGSEPNNYRTIMVGSTMEKLFGMVVERKIKLLGRGALKTGNESNGLSQAS
jgi:hypothetical protein